MLSLGRMSISLHRNEHAQRLVFKEAASKVTYVRCLPDWQFEDLDRLQGLNVVSQLNGFNCTVNSRVTPNDQTRSPSMIDFES